ncbi:nuclear transport factor 2 family protein [Winogradskyella sp.]|uniref:nuclear transport factor 2 family protein n=1 Tax=Winogradskyella sp. TaxID=1883156 RepID=UPI003BA94769
MKNLITTFYEAFNNLDAETMCSCYHEDIVFEDPAFGVLKGDKAKSMWQMLCDSQKGKNFKVVASNIEADSHKGSAHWEAFYNFSKTGRKVHNKIDAQFAFKDGLIISHKDRFNLHRWARQALGFKGLLFGGIGFFKSKLNRQTNRVLEKYIKEKKLSH